jgi:hypothetical protein
MGWALQVVDVDELCIGFPFLDKTMQALDRVW